MDLDYRVSVDLTLKGTRDGGRTNAIDSGYRPLCRFDRDPLDRLIGLGELDVPRPIQPGAAGPACLSFSESVSKVLDEVLEVGSGIKLLEGDRVVGSAVIRSYDRISSGRVRLPEEQDGLL